MVGYTHVVYPVAARWDFTPTPAMLAAVLDLLVEQGWVESGQGAQLSRGDLRADAAPQRSRGDLAAARAALMACGEDESLRLALSGAGRTQTEGEVTPATCERLELWFPRWLTALPPADGQTAAAPEVCCAGCGQWVLLPANQLWSPRASLLFDACGLPRACVHCGAATLPGRLVARDTEPPTGRRNWVKAPFFRFALRLEAAAYPCGRGWPAHAERRLLTGLKAICGVGFREHGASA